MNHIETRPPRPSPGQPGSISETLRNFAIYFATPDHVRRADPAAAWERARRLAMPHARQAVQRR
jgi:hypothetical protein